MTDLTLQSLDSTFGMPECPFQTDESPPGVSVDRRNGGVAHWFRANMDGTEVFVRLTRGETHNRPQAEVTTWHRKALEAIVCSSASALRRVLSDPQNRNSMLSIAGTGRYETEHGTMELPFHVYFGGRDITEENGEVGVMVRKLKDVADQTGASS